MYLHIHYPTKCQDDKGDFLTFKYKGDEYSKCSDVGGAATCSTGDLNDDKNGCVNKEAVFTHSFSYTHNRGDKKDRNTAVDRFDLVLLGQLNLEQADMGVGEQSKVAKELAKAISILKYPS